MPNYRLGKRAPEHDPRTFQLARYVARVPTAPIQRDWSVGVPRWMLGMNDKIGDCAIVGPANQIGGWTFNAQAKETVLTDAQIVSVYSAV